MTKQGKSLQDHYLNLARKEKIELTVYLVNGVPIKGFITLSKLLIQAAGEIAKSFEGLADIIEGAFNLDPQMIKKGFMQAKNQVGTGIDTVLLGLEQFARDEAQGFKSVLSNFGRLKGDDEKAAAAANATAGGAAALSSGSSPTSAATRTSVGGGISGGKDIKNIQVDIKSLVENITFESTGGESDQELQDRMTRVLVGAVNNFERLAGG